jgi:hypothetical protein
VVTSNNDNNNHGRNIVWLKVVNNIGAAPSVEEETITNYYANVNTNIHNIKQSNLESTK